MPVRESAVLTGAGARALMGGSDEEELVPTEGLLAGQAFHKAVQSAFRNGLASAFWERPWRLVAGRRGRVDLGVELDDRDSRMLAVIEINGTNWNKIPAGRVTRNVRRHLGQLQDCLDTAVEDMEAGSWNGVTGDLRYPARPTRAEAVEAIEAAAARRAIGCRLA